MRRGDSKRYKIISGRATLCILLMGFIYSILASSPASAAITNFNSYTKSARDEARTYIAYHAIRSCAWSAGQNSKISAATDTTTSDSKVSTKIILNNLAFTSNLSSEEQTDKNAIGWMDHGITMRCDANEVNRLFGILSGKNYDIVKNLRTSPKSEVINTGNCAGQAKESVNDSCLMMSTTDYQQILNSESNKYSKYESAGSISNAAWFAIWDQAFNQCTSGTYKKYDKVENDNAYYFPNGSDLRTNADGKLELGKVKKAKKGTDGDKVEWMAVANGTSNPMTCGQIYDEVSKNFPSYIKAYNNDVGKGVTEKRQEGTLTGGDSSAGNVDEDSDQEKCQKSVKGFGWILCPGVDLLSETLNRVSDAIGKMLEWRLLATSPDTTFAAWKSFANIANIAFAIAFLIMIYSMATGSSFASFSNYTLKKMLPRLVIVATAVNLSFYVCAALADLSNVAGQGIYDVIIGAVGCGNECTDVGSIFAAFGKAITSVLALGAGIIIGIFVFGGTVLIGFLMILLLVMMRNVLLTVLVIVSPVAIVLYLLPNTQKWAQKWSDMYIRTLLVYPMFMAVNGASILVSNLSSVTNQGGILTPIVPGLLGLMPLFAIIPIIRMSSSIMGQVTGAMQGFNKRHDLAGRVNRAGRRSAPVRKFNNGLFNAQQKMAGSDNVLARRIGGAIGNSALFASAATSGLRGMQARDDELKKLYGSKLAGLSNQQLMDIMSNESQPVAMRQAAAEKVDGKTLNDGDLARMLGIANSMKVDSKRGIDQRRVTAFSHAIAGKVRDADNDWYGKRYAQMIMDNANPNAQWKWDGKPETIDLQLAKDFATTSSPKSLVDSKPRTINTAVKSLRQASNAGDTEATRALVVLYQNSTRAQSLPSYAGTSLDTQGAIRGVETSAAVTALNSNQPISNGVRASMFSTVANNAAAFESVRPEVRQRIADTFVNNRELFGTLNGDSKQRVANASTANSIVTGFNNAVRQGNAGQMLSYEQQARTMSGPSEGQSDMAPEVRNSLRQVTKEINTAAVGGMPSTVAMPDFLQTDGNASEERATQATTEPSVHNRSDMPSPQPESTPQPIEPNSSWSNAQPGPATPPQPSQPSHNQPSGSNQPTVTIPQPQPAPNQSPESGTAETSNRAESAGGAPRLTQDAIVDRERIRGWEDKNAAYRRAANPNPGQAPTQAQPNPSDKDSRS